VPCNSNTAHDCCSIAASAHVVLSPETVTHTLLMPRHMRMRTGPMCAHIPLNLTWPRIMLDSPWGRGTCTQDDVQAPGDQHYLLPKPSRSACPLDQAYALLLLAGVLHACRLHSIAWSCSS
jgi:hypothetical protein